MADRRVGRPTGGLSWPSDGTQAKWTRHPEASPWNTCLISSLATCFVSAFAWTLLRVTTECKFEDAMASVALHLGGERDFHDFSSNWDRFHIAACEVLEDDIALSRACERGKTWRKKDLVFHAQVGNLLRVPFMVCTQVGQGDIALSWAQLAIPTSKLRDFCTGEHYHFGLADMLGPDAGKQMSLQRDAIIIDCPPDLRSEALKRAIEQQEASSSWRRGWKFSANASGMAPRTMMGPQDADTQDVDTQEAVNKTWRKFQRASRGSR